MKIAIPYYRVSTDRQGISGLGLDAQKKAVRDFAKQKKFKLIEEFTEIESGKNTRRPVLLQALASCKESNATLLIAKLDRLGRNVAFISALMESKIEFVAVDFPEATPLMLHIMAAFAQYEREQISKRTKDALMMAKEKGVILGSFGRNVLSKRNSYRSKQFIRKMVPTVKRLQGQGHKTVREIRDELNRREVPTYHKGKRWHLPTVHKIILEANKD